MKKILSGIKEFFKNPYKRMLALLLAVLMLIPNIGFVYGQITPDYNEFTMIGTETGVGSYSSDIYIYNSLFYKYPSQEIRAGKGVGFVLWGINTLPGVNAFIGDYPDDSLANTETSAFDISTAIDNLNFAGTISINTVNGGTNVVTMGAIGDLSTIGTLKLEDNAILELRVHTFLTIENLELGEGSELVVKAVDTDGIFKVKNITGSGNITIEGGRGAFEIGNASFGKLEAKTVEINVESLLHTANGIVLDNAKFSGINSSAKVTTDGDIDITDGEISNLALFGYDTQAVGSHTLTFHSNTEITSVSTFGIAESAGSASLFINGFSSISAVSGTTFVSDFPIFYYHNGDEMTEYDIVKYRAGYIGKQREIAKIHGTVNKADEFIASTALPEYVEPGYTFSGWSINNCDHLHFDLVEDGVPAFTSAGDISLTTSVVAGDVLVVFDHGFVPDEYTHNCQHENTSEDKREWYIDDPEIKVGSTVSIDYPLSRMGYYFSGWKIVSGHGDKELPPEAKSYGITYADLDDVDGIKTIKFEAIWTAETYPIRLSLAGSNVPFENTQISFDNGNSWVDMSEITSHEYYGNKFNWESTDRYISFTKEIYYGETIGAFFERLGCEIPLLRDTRDVTVAQSFAAWRTVNGTMVEEDKVFAYAPGGLVDNKKPDETLEDLAANLQARPMTFISAWGDMPFNLTVSNVEGWDVMINGESVSTSGETYDLTVLSGSKVQLRASLDSVLDASRWSVKTEAGKRVFMEEEAYSAGQQYVYYSFTMPKSNASALYGVADEYFDLAKSPITFEENVEYNNISRNGFWYNYIPEGYTPLFAVVDGEKKSLADLTESDTVTDYFYSWTKNTFNVTSFGVATKNQLTIINAMTVNLKECNLIARDEFVKNAVGRTIYGINLDLRSPSNSNFPSDASENGNIVINNNLHPSYALKLYCIGENTVSAIFQSAPNVLNTYRTDLSIIGDGIDSSTLNLGTVFGNIKLVINNILIKGMESQFAYLAYCANQDLQAVSIGLEKASIIAETREISVPLGNMSVYNNSKVDIKTVFIGYWIYENTNSYVRIRGDFRGYYFGFNLSGNSSAVVDGNLTTYNTWYQNNQTLNTTGYLVVRGRLMRAGHITLNKGTLITNTASIDFESDINGGKIITNQLVSLPEGTDNKVSYVRKRTYESDMFPFVTYTSYRSASSRLHLFKNCEVYLFGYYETYESNGKTLYKFSGDWNEEANPMNDIFDEVLDPQTGDLKANINLSSDYLRNKVEEQAEKYTENRECVAFGDASEDEGANASTITEIEISGTAKIYAAGSLTFFSRTTIKDSATVVSYGSLRSNRDLIIQDNANVTAKQIGSGWSLDSLESDGTRRWQQVILKGGTIKTDKLGNNDDTRTTIIIDGNSDIKPLNASEVSIVDDIRVNYIYGSEFEIEYSEDFDNIRLTGVWDNGLSEMVTPEKNFSAVSISEDNSVANWVLGSLTGEMVSAVNADGVLNNASQSVSYNFPKISLYAVKNDYAINVKEGLSSIKGITVNDKGALLTDSIGVTIGSEIVITLSDPSMTKKTVIWYFDASGILHNVIPTFNEAEGTVKFTMPASNIDLFVANEIVLDLYLHPVTMTENGFIIEEASPDNLNSIREDAKFEYTGNIRITQSNVESIAANSKVTSLSNDTQLTVKKPTGYDTYTTANRIIFLNNSDFERNVTIEEIYQVLPPEIYGVFAYNGSDIDLVVSGASRVESMGTDQQNINTKLTIKGEHQNGINKNTTKDEAYSGMDLLYLTALARQYNSSCFEAMDIDISNIVLLKMEGGRFFGFSSTDAALKLNNVYSTASCYAGELFAKGISTVTITDCSFDFITAVSNSNTLFYGVNDVTFINSRVTYLYGGIVTGGYPFGSIKKSLTLTDTDWHITRRISTDTTKNMEMPVTSANTPAVIIMNGNSKINADYRLHLIKLQMFDDSEILIREDDLCVSDSYFICKNTELNDNAKITADYVIISGFIEGTLDQSSTEGQFRSTVESGKSIVKSGVLTMNGGTIIAEQFFGGAYNPQINILNGSVTSPNIGSTTTVFGIVGITGTKNEQYVCRYDNAILPSQTSSTINVAGGTVNVTENGFIGGHNSTVTVSGGTVDLGAGAVLGLTETQRIEAENDATSHGKNPADEIAVSVLVTGGKVEGVDAQILVPYGNVQVSGAGSAVKIKDIIAEFGTVSILHSKGTYDITDVTTYANPPLAGVYIAEAVSAQSFIVKDGAIVYAKNIEGVIPASATSGGISITGEGTAVYTDSYGVRGEGATDESIVAIEYGEGQNIFCLIRMVPITYVLNGDKIDPAYNSPDNPDSYTQHPTEYIELKDANRHGFDFAGWYLNADFSGDRAYRLQRSYPDPVTLYAKWTPKKVTFSVYLDSSAGINVEEATAGVSPDLGTYDGTKFVYRTETLEYRTQLQGGTGIRLEDYNLPMHQILVLEIADSRYKGTGSQIYVESIVDGDIFDAFAESPDTPFALRVKDVQKIRERIIFNINLNSQNLPKSANFTSDSTEYVTTYTREAWVDYGSPIGSGLGFINDDGFIAADAPGYVFNGWMPAGGEIDHDLETRILEKDGDTVFYASWEPKKYVVKFDAVYDGSTITYSKEDNPEEGHGKEITGSLYYDEIINGNIDWSEELQSQLLPAAWSSGYKFSHWVVNDVHVGNNTKLNLTSFGKNLDEKKGNTEEVAITATAVYASVTVTYVTNEGRWQVDTFGGQVGYDDIAVHEAAWGDPLAGYVKDAVPGADYELISETAIYGSTYGIYSTTGAYYNANKSYVANDYRGVINRKGYTFRGWFTDNESANLAKNSDVRYVTNIAVATPQYEDITVYAAWSPNEYDLQLNAYDTAKTYEYTSFHNDYIVADGASAADEPPMVHVVVEQVLENGNKVNVSEWPERTETTDNWFAYNKEHGNVPESESDRRFLLGFTFAPLDPGSSNGGDSDPGKMAYLKYAAQVTQLINSGTLFSKGSSDFFIPDSYDYGGVKGIADYPSGSTIPMYGVYRERSIVFMERYNDGDGNIKEVEKAAYAYQSYVNYPATYEKESSKQEIEKKGYSLIGWYFYEPTATAGNKYPDNEAEYMKNLQTYLNASALKGAYDIHVYTVYAARVVKNDVVLTGDGKAFGIERADYIEYTVPGSMQTGHIKYTLSGGDVSKLKLVSKSMLENNRFTTSIPNAGTSDNTVAVVVTLTSPNGAVSHTMDITSLDAYFDQTVVVSAGWTIRLELYTSKVVTGSDAFVFDLVFGYTDENLKDQQIVFDDMKIQMKPSEYTIHYNAALPQNENLVIENDAGFSTDAQVISKAVNYGSPLMSTVPVLEGYENNGKWHQTVNSARNGQSRDFGSNFDLPVSDADNGNIYLEIDWSILDYLFTVEDEVLEYWDVSYTPMGASKINYTNQVRIPYHSVIEFTQKPDTLTYDEFVRLDWIQPGSNPTVIDRVSNLLEEGRTFRLDAHDLTASFERIRTLYLEDDNIVIYEETYTHKGETVTWHGDYVILMDKNNNIDGSDTANVLKLNENLADRDIKLGNLKITADNSITLADNASAKLQMQTDDGASTVEAKNISVPATSSINLTIPDSNKIGTVVLAPSVGYAGIGGTPENAANGKIELSQLNVDLTLPAGSSASGIGTADGIAAGKAITVNDCYIEVLQTETPLAKYDGTWIGGANVEKLELSNTSVAQKADSANPVISYAINAENVDISDCQIGNNGAVGGSIYAENVLNITNSTIEQSIKTTVVRAPIGSGTSNGSRVNITNSSVEVESTNGSWPNIASNELYSGKMFINDAQSTVKINDVRLLEVGNGNITITNDGCTQGTNADSQSVKYALLGNKEVATSEITVNSDAEIHLDPLSTDVEVKNISFIGNPVFTGATDISLIISENLAGSGDLTLNKISINAGGKVGSNGAIVAEGAPSDTPSYVTVTDNSNIVADTFGALGAQNETFTFVKTQGENVVIDAKLVQDHYRIEYIGDYTPATDYYVFRTELINGNETATLGNVPSAPADADIFDVWYYTADKKVYALSEEAETVPGYDSNAVLTSILPNAVEGRENEDATFTLYLYADRQILGTVVLAENRKFTAKAVTDNAVNPVAIPYNGSFTALLTAEGACIAGRQYQFAFDKPLVKDTRLTLVILEDNVSTYYYYWANGGETMVSVDMFTEMGKNNVTAQLPKQDSLSTRNVDTLLLALDFGIAKADAGDYKVEFNFGDENYFDNILDFTYTLENAVNGSISASKRSENSGSLTVSLPSDNSIFSGMEYGAVAEFISGTVPYGAEIKLGDAVGTRITNNRFVFEKIESSANSFTVDGVYGEFEIKWSLVVTEKDDNVFGTILSTAEVMEFNVPENISPWLALKVKSIDGSSEIDSYALEKGKKHTVVFEYETNAYDLINFIQVQNNVLASFDNYAGSNISITGMSKGSDKGEITSGTFTVTFGESVDAGVYRVAASLNGESLEDFDNSYCSFVIH